MKDNDAGVSRRKVLRGVAGGGAAFAATGVTLTDDAQAFNPGLDETRARYRETAHVKAFYRTNGYETKNRT